MSHLAYVKAITRIEFVLTAALHERQIGGPQDETAIRLLDDATALADEWNLQPSMRRFLLNAALENVRLGRVLTWEQEEA